MKDYFFGNLKLDLIGNMMSTVLKSLMTAGVTIIITVHV